MHHATTLAVPERTCSREDRATLFVSLELSRSTWVTTALVSGSSKMSKHTLAGGDARKLLDLLARLKSRAEERIVAPVKVVAIQEVGLDGFWIHRLLEANGVESHVVETWRQFVEEARPLRSSSQWTCMGLFLSSGCFGLC